LRKEGGREGGVGAAVYAPEHKLCTLRTFEGGKEGVDACLKGKHVVFVGDSVTRYQYLSLVSFLEKGGWEEEGGKEDKVGR